MKANETPKMKPDEAGWLTALVILELLILPSLPLGKYGGGVAMAVLGFIGLPVYFILFRQRLRSRGQLKTAAILAGASIVVGMAATFVLLGSLRGHLP